MLFLLLIITVAAQEKVFYEDENAANHFKDFIQTYNKEYVYEEKIKRFAIFKQNLKEINRLNSLDDAVFGITEFADLTADEIRTDYMGFNSELNYTQKNTCILVSEALTDVQAPDSLDYRQKHAVTEVKNQGKCHTCWLFGSIGTIEGSYALKHGELLSFSEEQLMNCLKCSGGCTVASVMVLALSELSKEDGIMLESDYPYTGKDQSCQIKKNKIKVKVTGCYNFLLEHENYLKDYLFQYGPITIAINYDAAQFYKRGIFTKKSCPSNGVNHAVLLVGYGTENGTDYWIVKNSFGECFGEKGYMRMSRGENTCGLVNYSAASAIVA